MARTRAKNYDERRRDILHRSAELFATHGFTGTSTSMIADACGVSKALLYHYYASKEAVLFDLLDYHLQDLIEVVEAASVSTDDRRKRLLAIAAALLDAYRGADAPHQVQISSLKLLPREKQEVLKDIERQLVAIVSDAIAHAIPTIGRDPRLLKPITMSFFGMLNWHYLWFRQGKGLTRDEYASLVTGLVLDGAEKAAAFMAANGESKLAKRPLAQKASGKRAGRSRNLPL